MAPSEWAAPRHGTFPDWLRNLEPLTTGLLAHQDMKLWCAGERAALGIRSGGVVYPVWLSEERALGHEAKGLLDRVGTAWCLMGPSAWVNFTEPLMPASRILHRVHYEFMARPAGPLAVPDGRGELRPVEPREADTVFPLHEAYEKEEVLFDPSEFHPVASRLHWGHLIHRQRLVALWDGGQPLAKAGTNALTDRWAQIGGVYTRMDYRRLGLQKRLMAYLVGLLAEEGKGCCLFVKKENGAALGLYRNLGFESRGDFLITYGERQSWAARRP